MVEDLVQRRAAKLARGLRRIGAATGPMGILVCDEHRHDRHVACLAATLHGASPVALPLGPDLARALEPLRGSVLVACAEGVAEWRATGIPMRVVGDGDGVVWWKALELRDAT